MSKIYPDSHVEIQGFSARHYDGLMNLITGGVYSRFIKSAIAAMNIQPQDRILDLGSGTGRNACLMHGYLDVEGHILGMDISEDMGRQFRQKCQPFDNMEFKIQRVDQPFTADEPFEKIFMSFVLHGFPHEYRMTVLDNISRNIKTGGRFFLLDFSEFKLKDMPALYRWLFTTFECKYAFDFVERDWQLLFGQKGFRKIDERFWFKNYVRLMTLQKIE